MVVVVLVVLLVVRWRRGFGLGVGSYGYPPPGLMVKMRNEGEF